jgi:hypothetical protein
MSNPGPAVEGTSNPAVLTGGQFGAVVGTSGETVGFFGAAGAVKGTLPANATDLTTAEALVNAIKAMLIASGYSN